MERLSPKIEIINHFDNLINRIDIDIDSALEKYNEQKIGDIEILKSLAYNEWYFRNLSKNFKVEFFDENDSSKHNLNSWSESMKIVDYLKQIRIKTIDQLKKAQEETLEYYKINSERFKNELTKDIEKLRSEFFAEKFYFQVNFKQSENRLWPFNVFTFVTDFYISQSYIDSLEKLINWQEKPFSRDCIFDDKIVLTGLLFKCLIDNLLNFPAHVIYISKKNVLNIESIKFKYEYSGISLTSQSTIDLSKLVNLDLVHIIDTRRSELVKFNIEGLSALKTLQFKAKSLEIDFSIRNLPLLTSIYLSISGKIDEKIVTGLLEQVTYIQELCLEGFLCYFNLDDLVNLRVLSLDGILIDNFNFELFKNLCKHLENIKIDLKNIKKKTWLKLFDGYNFPYLEDLTIENLKIKMLKKKFINRLPKPRINLNINRCGIEVIESDSFSNMQQLTSLNLSCNRIELIEENAFLNLNNLQKLDLSCNKLTKFDRIFIGLGNSVEKMVLTGLLFKYFIDNLLNFPNHVIHVRKEDVLNIQSIDFKHKYSVVNLISSSTIDLSNKLENLYLIQKDAYWIYSIEYNIEGLLSLKRLFKSY